MDVGQVHVVFVDASTGQAIGQTVMPLERLPASFATSTTMHIGGDDWNVVRAEPLTADEFGRTGELQLTLARIQRISPQAILYTMPSLWADLPPSSPAETLLGKHVLKLHEDDWRQVELVSAQYQDAIAAEFEAVARIFQESSEFNGRFRAFRNIHMRHAILDPLRPAVQMSQVLAALPRNTHRFDGVSFERENTLIQGGVAFDLGGLLLYGLHMNGVAHVLGVQRLHGEALGADVASALTGLMDANRLYLVDWCNRIAVPAQEQAVRDYLLASR